jgi:pyridinium-3,5-bisthiocarboxylic acid mononucleotide nickel chelatase
MSGATSPRRILLDPIGGLAGDMFIAAAIATWPDFERPVLQAIRDSGLPRDWEIALRRSAKADLGASVFRCAGPRDAHPSGSYRDFRERLATAPLSAATRRHALGLLELLGDAEAKVHGVPRDSVHFHELADWDTQADLVGAARIIELLGEISWFYRPLPLGGGVVRSAHGPLPVPAPATAVLLEGFAWRDDGVAGERVTPTGAAILRYLGAEPPPAAALGRLLATGAGAGTRDLPGIPNILRILAFAASDRLTDSLLVIEFDIDDQSPEDLARGLDRLRGLDAVRDVVLFQGIGKKGRPLHSVRLLAAAEGRESVLDAVFRETTTIGLRLREEQRVILPRRLVTVSAGERRVRVKLAERPDGTLSGKADADDVAEAGDAAARQALRETAVAQALQDEEKHD